MHAHAADMPPSTHCKTLSKQKMVCTQGNLLVLTPKDMILCCSISALVEAPAEAMRSNTRWSGVLASEGIVFFCFSYIIKHTCSQLGWTIN